jgi:hypothetical protein
MRVRRVLELASCEAACLLGGRIVKFSAEIQDFDNLFSQTLISRATANLHRFTKVQ